MDHYKNLKFYHINLWGFCLSMLFAGCSVQQAKLGELNGIYCVAKSNKEFNSYTIIRIEESNIALERIYTTVGQITYYGEGVITKRNKRKVRIKFVPYFDCDRGKQYYTQNWEGRFYLKILPNSRILLVDSYNGKISRTIFYTNQCDCITNDVESFILGTRKFSTELLNH